MGKLWPYIMKSLWGHRTRTLLTVSGTAVAIFVFCFVTSVQDGLEQLTSKNDSVLVVFQANKFCPATSHLPQDYAQRIRHLSGVREVLPVQVFTNNCRASLDVVVFYGVPATQVRRLRDFELVGGSWSEFEGHQDAGIVGESLARRRGIKAGEKFTIGDVNVTVAGIFSSDDRAEEDYVYCHLDFLQRTRGLDLVGTVTQHEVVLDATADAQATCEAIDEMFRGGPVETDTRPKGVFQAASLADLVHLIELTGYLGYACVGLMIVLVSTTTLMTVQDRLREHAVLQTLGFTPYRVFGLVVAESVATSLAGGILGVTGAMAALWASGLSIGAEAVTIAFVPSVALVASGLLTSLLSGVVAGVAPAWQAATAPIVPALRRVG